MVHEAYQFLRAKKKKKSGRSMVENWNKVGGKAKMVKLDDIVKKP